MNPPLLHAAGRAANPRRDRSRSPGIWLLAALMVPASALAQSEAYDWRNVAIGGGGFVTGTVFHPTEPGLVYARTDVGGAYRLDTATNRWIPLNDEVGGRDNEFQYLGVLSIGLDPNDANRVYLACGEYTGFESWWRTARIYRSTDRGATWAYSDTPFKVGGNEEGRGTGERLAVDPVNGANILVGSSNAGIWRSTDSGATWSQLTNFPTGIPQPAEAGCGMPVKLLEDSNIAAGWFFLHALCRVAEIEK